MKIKYKLLKKEDAGVVFKEWLPYASSVISIINNCFYLLYNGFYYETEFPI